MRGETKFFTNEPENDLYGKFQSLLKNNAQFFDIMVAYFWSSGFYRMYDALESTEKIRVLVGLGIDKNIFTAIKAAKENFADTLQEEFDEGEFSANVERGARKFIEWLKSGKIEMRLYNLAPLHSKIYITRKKNFGSVITGSSNFSKGGLITNLEFNVELKDKADVDFALKKFEEFWADGVDISEEYISTVENRTWLRNNITPYEIYLKTIYEFFKEEINADKDAALEGILPPNFFRLKYQMDAVIQAKKILEAYGGVFIADVVGLGKTYICAMLSKILPYGKKLIICPPVLMNMWQDVFKKFGVADWEVESLGKLDRIAETAEKFTYIFIDEAHRFRRESTQSYSNLHKICRNKKIVLISATPINNYSTDIEAQIELFQNKNKSTIVGVRNLEKFFKELDRKAALFPKGSKEYLLQLDKNSKEIRDKILRYIMIRRTRHEILKYYGDDLKKQNVTFPKLGTPQAVAYEFDAALNNIFNETVNIIKNFKYARYTPLLYLTDSNSYKKMLTGQRNLSGFMKSIFVKRLESSFFAFKNTLRRFEISYEKFIEMYNGGEIFISRKFDVYEFLDSGNTEKLFDAVENDEALYFKSSEFGAAFIVDLKKDLRALKRLREIWENVTADPKLEKLKSELKNNKKFFGNKKIIFTESKETAEYLYAELKEIFGEKIIVYTGDSSRNLKFEIEKSFDPKSENAEDKYDLLIATDVLAEGINLHRANALINYDLPWNPTKIMQRVGRINRIGTAHAEIFVFNFFPTEQSAAELPLEERILEKLHLFHETLGEDFKYLSEAENVSPKKLFDELTANLDDAQENDSELEYLKIIRDIRDNNKKLFEKIKRLPKKARVAKFFAGKNATITFLRYGALKTFFLSDGGETKRLSFADAMDFLKCEKNTQVLPLSSNFFSQHENNCNEFANLLSNDDDDFFTAQFSRTEKNIIQTLQALKTVTDFTDIEQETIQKMLAAWHNGTIPKKISSKVAEKIKTASNPVKLYHAIKKLVEVYLHGREDLPLAENLKRQIILSCNLRGD